MPTAKSISRGLAGIAQGFNQLGTVAEQQIRLEQRKEEHQMNLMKKELFEIEIGTKKKAAGLSQVKSLSQEASVFETDSERKQWINLPTQQAKIQQISQLTGADPATVAMNITNETLANKTEREVQANLFESLAKSKLISGYAPEFGAEMQDLAKKIKMAKTPEEAERLRNAGNEAMKRYSSLTKSFESGKAVVSPSQAVRDFVPAKQGDEGAQIINVAGQGEKLVKPKPKKTEVTSSEQKIIKGSIDSAFGINPDIVKHSKDKSQERFALQAELVEDVSTLMRDTGANASVASNEILKKAKLAITDTRDSFGKAVDVLLKKSKSKDKEEANQAKEALDRMKAEFGTINPKKIKDSQLLRVWKLAPGNSLIGDQQPQQ